MDQWMSCRQLDDFSTALGAWLRSRGLASGARVAIFLPNIPQFPVTMLGVLHVGFACVNVNLLYIPREFECQPCYPVATCIIIFENFRHTFEEFILKTRLKAVVVAFMSVMLCFWYVQWFKFAVRHLEKMVLAYKFPLNEDVQVTAFNRAIAEGGNKTPKLSQANLDSTAFLQHTSGTNGLSKGAVLTHRNIIPAILQGEAWFSPALKTSGDASKINNIATLPPHHIFALILSLLAICNGSHSTMIANPRDFGKFIEVLKKRPFHMLPAVSTYSMHFCSILNSRPWRHGCV
jgi:long-chain acyl-CoA synthetase